MSTHTFTPVSIPREKVETFDNWVCIGISRGSQFILFLQVSIPREMSGDLLQSGVYRKASHESMKTILQIPREKSGDLLQSGVYREASHEGIKIIL